MATTGYAKDTLRDVICADVALVETVAHAKSALHYYEQPDAIVDVGGQDIKLIILKDGRVKDFKLNTQCSAGNGYFLQAIAEGFGIRVEEFADIAFTARAMPVFPYGCAVFLQADIASFQGQGWKPHEILAGLAAVLPKNVWLYIAKIPNLPELGTRFILQGGTQNNLAAVKAQVDFIRSRFHGSGRTPEIICAQARRRGRRDRRRFRGHATLAAGAEDHVHRPRRRAEDPVPHDRRRGDPLPFLQERVRPDVHRHRYQRRSNAAGHAQHCRPSLRRGETPDRRHLREGNGGGARRDEGDPGRICDAAREANPNLVEYAAREVWRVHAQGTVARSVAARGR